MCGYLIKMINPICHAFQHNSMLPYCKKTIYECKIGDSRNWSKTIQVKTKNLVYEIRKPTLFNQIRFTNRCETLYQIFIFIQLCPFKACVRYFLSNSYFSPTNSPSKTMTNIFYFILKALFVLEIFEFLYFRLPLFFSLSTIALEVDPRKILKLVMSSTV